MSGFERDNIWNYVSDDEYDYPFEEPHHYQDKYLYDYRWYHEKFPLDWAVNYKDGTGPGQCNNCADYGSINGIFIGYCANCAEYDYGGDRGRGFIDVGVEFAEPQVLCFQSAFDTYLKDVDIWAIQAIDDEIKEDFNDVEYPEEDDICEDNTGTGIMNCHFEGGYNDF
jgi:hypothetical protein